ncbi:MAG: hypothetical protein Q9218_002142 [Villophora microphyllina]
MTAPLSVHSHHINIDVGDSAIHLLVDDSAAKDNSNDVADQPVIHNAVLIDGGRTTGLEAIKSCIERIESSYTFWPTKTAGKLKFDAIMITHWDFDHWGGVRALLQDSLTEYLSGRTDLKTLSAASTSQQNSISKLYWAVAGLQHPLFKYAGGEPATIFTTKSQGAPTPAPTPVAPGTLLTTFYVPYIDDERSGTSYRLAPKTTDMKAKDHKLNNSGKAWFINHDKEYNHGGANTLGLLGHYKYMIDTGKGKFKADIQAFKFFDLCKLAACPEDYLGAEVFTNKALPASPFHKTVTNPGLLVKAHSLKSSMGPRMFIVAGDQVILGDTPLAQSATVAAPVKDPTNTGPPQAGVKMAFHPIVRIVDERGSVLGQRQGATKYEGASRNVPSLACLVISSTTDAPESIDDKTYGTSWRLWHFMAGDAFWDVEGAIAAWLSSAPSSNPKTTFMKISHHGGAGSTSSLLLNTLLPNVVITPAGDNQNFGHPPIAGPELLMYLHALSLNIKPRWMRVYGFCWPIWMFRPDDFSLDNFNTLPDILPTTITDDHQVFVQQLLNLYAAYKSDNPLSYFWNMDYWLKSTRPPKWEGKGKEPKDAKKDREQKKRDWESIRVQAMTAALKPFFVKICGQSLGDLGLGVGNRSIIAMMNGTTSRFKELRKTGALPHEWQIYQEDPQPPKGPPNFGLSPPLAGPKFIFVDTQAQEKRKIEDGTKADTPDEQAKVIKVPNGALKQEDADLLRLDDLFDAVLDIDTEAGNAPTVAPAIPDLEEDDVVMDNTDDAVKDEEMPEAEDGKVLAQKVLLQSKLATPAAMYTAPSATVPVLTSNPGATASNHQLPIRATVSAVNTPSVAATEAASDDPASTPPATPFYLCGSDFDPFTPDNTQAPLAPGAFSDWIANLKNGYVALANEWVQPPSNTKDSVPPAPVPVSADLHASDEWFQRLYCNDLGIQQVAFVGYIDAGNSNAHVTRVDVNLKLRVIASTPMDLTFSSDASNTVSMGASAASSSPSLGDAILPDYSLFALGLQKASQTTLTVGQIVSYFGMACLPIGSTGGFTLPGFDPVSTATATLDMSPGSRSSLSFKPDVMYSTWLRLRFLIKDADFTSTFSGNFSFLGQISLSNTAIVVMSKAECPSGFINRDLTSQCGLETQITLGGNFDPLSISAWVKFEYKKTSIILEFNNTYSWSQIEGWLASILSTSDASSDKSIDPTALVPNTSEINFAVRKVTLILSNPGSGSGFSVLGASILFEITVYKTIFSLELDWPGPSITARLWNSIVPNVSTYALLPYIESYDQYTPLGTPTGTVSFGDICGSAVTPPPGTMNLSPTFYKLEFTASYNSSKQLRYRFTGTLQSLPLTSGSGVPKVVLGDLDFAFAYAPSSGYDVLLSTTLQLIPRDFPTTLASLLTVSVEYIDKESSSSWQVVAYAQALSFATLYNLFDADASDAVMDILGTLTIPELEVIWDYSLGEANLLVDGLLRVGPFDLDLTYQYLHDSGQGQSAWIFSASLGTHKSQSSTLYDLVQSLGVDQDVLDTLADVQFVANMNIPAATPSPGSRPPVSLSITKEAGKETIFWIQIAISTAEGTLSFTYVQLQGARSAANASTPPTGFKRIIRVMLDHLPVLPGVPVVGPIPQPVDAIDYLWVGDSTVDNTTHTAGLTQSDMALINSTMSAENYIPYKHSRSSLQSAAPGNAASATANPYVLLAGHHFLVQANGSVILDHLFGKASALPVAPQAMLMSATPDLMTTQVASGAPTSSKVVSRIKQTKTKKTSAGKKGKKANTAVTRFAATSMLAAAPAPATAYDPSAAGASVNTDSGSTKAPLSKSIGPLTIQNIGLQTKNGYLYILIDATVALGPLQLTVVGFGVGLPLARFNLNELKNLIVSDFDVILSGMSVYFNSPPVLISGVFIIDSKPTYEAYKGGLSVSIDPYSLLAVGEYRHTYDTDLKSVFVFGRFDGPLLTLEFAEISGVEVGYNYSIRTPTAADILNFPLVQGVTAQPNPMDTLTKFSQYVSVEKDSVWFAFGFKLDAIQVISMDAAAIVQFSATDVTVAIVGIASASMPPHVKDRKEMFLYVELGVVAALDITGGRLICQAQLTPNSFVLYPGE